MTITKRERELERIHRSRIALGNSGLADQFSPHLRRKLQNLERREAVLVAEIAAERGTVAA